MIPDVCFEATFLRAALLLGKVREAEVRQWADELLAIDAEPVALLADVSLAPPELTALREALRPIALPSPPESLGVTLLAFLATDPHATSLSTPDRIRVLGQLRREDILARGLAADIKAFENRLMLAAAGLGVDLAIAGDLDRWLGSVHGPRYYRVSIADPGERAAFLGALSRKVVRDRHAMTMSSHTAQAWIAGSTSTSYPALVLNAALWRIAVAEFSPLPLGSRIPYDALPTDAVLVLEEASAEPMGAREAAERLAMAC